MFLVLFGSILIELTVSCKVRFGEGGGEIKGRDSLERSLQGGNYMSLDFLPLTQLRAAERITPNQAPRRTGCGLIGVGVRPADIIWLPGSAERNGRWRPGVAVQLWRSIDGVVA
jgi:hypothetical protein